MALAERQFEKMSWAYVAGFFDGEGCVDIKETTQSENSNGTSRGIRRQFRLKFYQSRNLEVLEEIQKFLATEGISSSVQLVNSDYEYRALVVGGALNCVKALLQLERFVIVKLEKIQEALVYAESLLDDFESGKLTGRGKIASYGELRKVV